LGAVDAYGAADFGGGFVLDDVEMVDGVVRGIDLAFDAGEGLVEAEFVPLGFPEVLEGRGGEGAELGGVVIGGGVAFGVASVCGIGRRFSSGRFGGATL
jgi:hypothetical protein